MNKCKVMENRFIDVNLSTTEAMMIASVICWLRESDYINYLFTLIRFNTYDVEKMGSIEFAYRVYDSHRADEIRNHQADLIDDLLNYYEGYVNKTNQHILINLLRFSGKLIITEW